MGLFLSVFLMRVCCFVHPIRIASEVGCDRKSNDDFDGSPLCRCDDIILERCRRLYLRACSPQPRLRRGNLLHSLVPFLLKRKNEKKECNSVDTPDNQSMSLCMTELTNGRYLRCWSPNSTIDLLRGACLHVAPWGRRWSATATG